MQFVCYFCLLINSPSVFSVGHLLPSQRIHNGEFAQTGDFPFTVLIEISKKSHCTGVLYNYQTVVTAAHCPLGLARNVNKIVVYAGSAQSGEGLMRKVQRAIPHPSYFPIFKYGIKDVALLHLDTPYPINSRFIYPIPFYWDESLLPTNSSCILSGFGNIFWFPFPEPRRHMTFGTVPLLPQKICSLAWFNKFESECSICAGGSGSSPRVFDSGGPLVCNADGRWVVYGIVNVRFWPLPNGHSLISFAKVGAHSDWFYDNACYSISES